LLEVVLVIGLISIVAAFAWPNLERRLRRSELPESADQFRSLLHLTRAQAMLENQRYRIRFEPKAQHPIVEAETDPFASPGRYEPVKTDWAREARLLGDVNVHAIRIGRPDYTLPLDDERSESDATDERTATQEDSSTATGDVGADGKFDNVAGAQSTEDEVPIDETRPPIVFEPDGSSDWLTVVLVDRPLDQPLDDEVEQEWIELDGRTGLARRRDPLTAEQMADATLRIPRSKLRPPEAMFGAAAGDRSMNVTQQQQAGGGGAFGDAGSAGGGAPSIPGLGAIPGLGGGLPSAGGAPPFGQTPPSGGEQSQPRPPRGPRRGGDERRPDPEGESAAQPPPPPPVDEPPEAKDPPPAPEPPSGDDDEPDNTTQPAPPS